MHHERDAQLQRTLNSDAKDPAVFRQMVLHDLAADMRVGFLLSYYRSFGVPRISAVLAQSGEIARRPSKRASDTGIVIYEIVSNGFDSDRGQEMVDLLRRVHANLDASNDEYVYILLTLLIVPIRWTQAHGWRPVTDVEIASATEFFRELGERMGIRHVPDTYAQAEDFFDRYEVGNVRAAPENIALTDATVHIVAGRLPRVARPFVRPILSAMMDDKRFSAAIGLPEPSRFTTGLVRAAMRVRAARTRRSKPSNQARFVPGGPGSSTYPNGYALSEIGPEA